MIFMCPLIFLCHRQKGIMMENLITIAATSIIFALFFFFCEFGVYCPLHKQQDIVVLLEHYLITQKCI